MACEVLPAPNELSTEKIQNLLCSGVTSIEQLPPQTQDLKNGLSNSQLFRHDIWKFQENVPRACCLAQTVTILALLPTMYGLSRINVLMILFQRLETAVGLMTILL